MKFDGLAYLTGDYDRVEEDVCILQDAIRIEDEEARQALKHLQQYIVILEELVEGYRSERA